MLAARKTNEKTESVFSTGLRVPSVKYEQEAAIISDVSNATEAPLREYRPLNGADLYFDTTARTGGNCIEY